MKKGFFTSLYLRKWVWITVAALFSFAYFKSVFNKWMFLTYTYIYYYVP